MNQRISATALAAVASKYSGRKAYFEPSLPTCKSADQVYEDLLRTRMSTLRELSPSEDFKWEYLLDSLLSKYARDSVSPSQRQQAAIDKMIVTERRCADLNKVGILQSGDSFSAERFNTVVLRAQDIVKDILGEFHYGIFEDAKFSSGASTSRRRAKGDPYFKYSSKTIPLDVTKDAYPYACALIRTTPAWARLGATMKIVTGNGIFTVPKKTEIDRCCAKEPDLNLALQRSIGLYMRSQLLTVGITLSDQTRNQRLALRGSRYDNLATIDLSSASDSIATSLVKFLLPPDWFHVLDALRSKQGVLPNGDTLLWEKFSSMGNGFTFELESMIFYCLTKATLDYERSCGLRSIGTISVYGDDIICPTVVSDNVIAVLSGCGFSANLDKTFTRGPFRESCGKHYYNGIDVTPIYIKSDLDDIFRLIWFVNRLRRWSYCAELASCDDSFYGLWRYYARLVPARLRGACNIESSDSIYSPGKIQDRLVSHQTKSPFRGDAAYLRAFQNQPSGWHTWCSNQVSAKAIVFFYRKIAKDNPGDTDMNSNIHINPKLARYKANLELWTPRTYLFSREM